MQSGLLTDSFVQVFDKCSAARENNSAISEVGRELGGRVLQHDTYGIDDDFDTFVECLPNLLIGNDDTFRNALHQVAALDLHRPWRIQNICGSDLDFDLLGRSFPDQEVVFAFDVLGNRFIHLVSRRLLEHARIRKTRYMHNMRCLLINRRSLLLALRLLWKTPYVPSNSRFPRLCAKCLIKLKRLVSILPMTKSKK